MIARRLRDDARILWQFARGQSATGDHAARLQAFYAPQAARYDEFRERLLHGRAELLDRLAPAAGAHLVELGAGTGRNVAYLATRPDIRIDLVDLCPALAAVARARVARMPNVCVHEADATTWQPVAPVDHVLMSYALTMMPDWRAVVDNAVRMLRPGGTLAVVDFYVSASRPAAHRQRHHWLARQGWRGWFGHDGVCLDPAHLDWLEQRTVPLYLSERMGPVPYLPGLRAPYYLFIGRTPRQD